MSKIKQILFEDKPEEKRQQFLKDNCCSCEEAEVQIPLSPIEISQAEETILSSSDKIDILSSKLEKLKANYDERKKEITKEMIDPKFNLSVAIEQRRSQVKEVKEEVYYFDDQENKLMLCYDKRGHFINSRPLTPNERQTSIFSIKNGTND